jgi:cytochrome c553
VSLRTVIVGLGLGLSVLAVAASAQTPSQPPETMAARVEACTPCHGDNGQGTSDVYFPRLAGKPAGYLYNQLLAFKNGRRKYPPMNYLLEYLTDPYLQEIADYFASQHPPLPPESLADCCALSALLVCNLAVAQVGGMAVVPTPTVGAIHLPGSVAELAVRGEASSGHWPASGKPRRMIKIIPG